MHIDQAGAVSGLSVELSGALGKRTRYQEKELAQLRLTVTTTPSDRGEESVTNSMHEGQSHLKNALVPKCVLTLYHPERIVPKDLQLHDDTLLDQVMYSDLKATPTPKLSALEQAIILGQW